MSLLRNLLMEILRPVKLILEIDEPSEPLMTVRKRRENSLFVSVKIPGHIEPLERGEWFEVTPHE